jgi:hypothetical protein
MIPVVLHIEVEFDTGDSEPRPWWRPFGWARWYRNPGHRQGVLRFGALGFHVCFSVAWYLKGESNDPTEQ